MTVRVKSIVVASSVALLLSAWMGAVVADDVHSEDAAHDHADETGHESEAENGPAEGHADYNKPPINPNWGMLRLFLFSLVLFWVFLFVARKLAWLPLIQGLDAREARVNQALADAEAARIAAQKLIAEHQAHLDEVTEQIKAIIAQARTDAEQEKARIIAEADAETTALRDRAIADIHAASKEALAGLDERIESQVSTATQHVLG